MPSLFVDTSGWGNLIAASEPHHRAAAEGYRDARDAGHAIVTTSYVISELVALLVRPLRVPRRQMIDAVNGIRTSPCVEVVHVTPELDVAGWRLLVERPDKEWTLVDCVSFVVMAQRGLRHALTTDHHFEQAGMIRLLG